MKDRLIQFIKGEGLTVSRFQQQIGVKQNRTFATSARVSADVLLSIGVISAAQLPAPPPARGEMTLSTQTDTSPRRPQPSLRQMIPVLPVSAHRPAA